ncbi:MAG: 2-isopropylmalate synthase [Nitrospira sp.]|nr:2-isopropylmalate synthase [Nitrospira sp.]
MRTIKIFDTTLRDGEQSPGASMNTAEKLQLAKQLARMGVDIIEAGFAIASPGDFEAIKTIAGEVEGPTICSLARAKEEDIKRAWEAIKDAPKKRIHTFHSTSDIHLKYQYRIGPEEALKRSIEMVKFAKSFTDDVEFSPMDATRTDMGYLCEVIEAVIEAGAITVNIPDTVGYSIPSEFGGIIKEIRKKVNNIDKAVISVHCHNDLGLSTSNSLAAVLNGAGQIECTINGIGERAGNCSMEEVVMALRTRRDLFNADTNINTEEIMRSSRLVTSITGMSVQPNKAIVGANAFSHESGIHQDGLLKEKSTYEIITPESIGLSKTKYVLGKHSGRNAFRTKLSELGFTLNDDDINSAFKRFKEIADQKKDIYDEDLVALVSSEVSTVPEKYKLIKMSVSSGTGEKPSAMVKMRVGSKTIQKTQKGDGPIDAIFKAITQITGTKSKLLKYEVKAITGGTDALGEVVCSLEENDISVSGHGADTDIITASAKAYINALNKIAARKK